MYPLLAIKPVYLFGSLDPEHEKICVELMCGGVPNVCEEGGNLEMAS